MARPDTTMKIKMLTSLSGPEYCLSPGDVREFPQAEAARLVAAGYAVPDVEPTQERAVKKPITEKRG